MKNRGFCKQNASYFHDFAQMRDPRRGSQGRGFAVTSVVNSGSAPSEPRRGVEHSLGAFGPSVVLSLFVISPSSVVNRVALVGPFGPSSGSRIIFNGRSALLGASPLKGGGPSSGLAPLFCCVRPPNGGAWSPGDLRSPGHPPNLGVSGGPSVPSGPSVPLAHSGPSGLRSPARVWTLGGPGGLPPGGGCGGQSPPQEDVSTKLIRPTRTYVRARARDSHGIHH